jgi:RHS repeat-associated protein
MAGMSEDPVKIAPPTGPATYYAYGLSVPIAQVSGSSFRTYVPNLHGDLSLLANSNGVLTDTQSYSPWGEKRVKTGSTTPAFSFQSDLTDANTALVDMGARLYYPALGRFVTRDSLFGDLKFPLSMNKYIYGVDSPISLIDPTGQCPQDPDNPGVCSDTESYSDVVETNALWWEGNSRGASLFLAETGQLPAALGPALSPTRDALGFFAKPESRPGGSGLPSVSWSGSHSAVVGGGPGVDFVWTTKYTITVRGEAITLDSDLEGTTVGLDLDVKDLAGFGAAGVCANLRGELCTSAGISADVQGWTVSVEYIRGSKGPHGMPYSGIKYTAEGEFESISVTDTLETVPVPPVPRLVRVVVAPAVLVVYYVYWGVCTYVSLSGGRTCPLPART